MWHLSVQSCQSSQWFPYASWVQSNQYNKTFRWNSHCPLIDFPGAWNANLAPVEGAQRRSAKSTPMATWMGARASSRHRIPWSTTLQPPVEVMRAMQNATDHLFASGGDRRRQTTWNRTNGNETRPVLTSISLCDCPLQFDRLYATVYCANIG